MTMGRVALLGLALAIGGCGAAWAQEEDETPMWRLRTVEKQSVLSFGTGNEEDTPISFLCKAGAGAIDVFIAETGEGVKPNQAATAQLTAGAVVVKVKGRTEPNEEAGVPSFAGVLPATDPLFAALAKAPTLAMAVGPAKREVPLKGIGDKADQLSRTCKRP